MFAQAVKVKGLLALICSALWSRVGVGEGQLPWRWAVVGRHWGLSSEQTALYKSSMWQTMWNRTIFVSEKSRNTMHRRSKRPQCSLGAKSSAERKPETLWAFEGWGRWGGYGSRTGSPAEGLCEVWREGVIFIMSVQEKRQVWAQKLEQAIQKPPDNWWR